VCALQPWLPQKADESDHRNLFKDETNAAVDEWLAANNLSNKTPAYLTRGQFIRVMRNFGFDSKVRCVRCCLDIDRSHTRLPGTWSRRTCGR